jgi:hypothetical protein
MLLHDLPGDGGGKHLWNVSKLLPDYTAQYPRRQAFSYSPPWEPEISQVWILLKYISILFNVKQRHASSYLTCIWDVKFIEIETFGAERRV